MRYFTWFCLFFIAINISVGQESKILPLDRYLSKANYYKLDYVIKVESSGDILTLHGYHNENNTTLYKKKVKLDRNDVLQIRQLNSKEHRISLMTIPFKIRPLEKNLFGSHRNMSISIFSFW